MKLFIALAGLLVAGSLTLGLPTPSEYSQLAPSERAAIDATNLIVCHFTSFKNLIAQTHFSAANIPTVTGS